VEETVLAPLSNGAKFFISPHGVHLATYENSGSRAVIYYDGVPGPKFDEILGGSINSSVEIELAFSPDGRRYAYCGRSGNEMVVMVDGKEFLRTTESNMGRFDGSSCTLGFTSNSEHVYLFSDAVTSLSRGGGRTRFLFDGREAPGSATTAKGGSHDLRNVAFSPDGNHYAMIVTDSADDAKWALVIDGKVASYRGGAPRWSADSQHLYTTIDHPGANPTTEAMLDGKVFIRAEHLVLHVAPAGNMTVAVIDAGIRTPSPTQFLVVDGKKVPGSEIVHQRGAQIDQITFSPDGKHYAARYSTTQNRQYLFVDGKRAQEYQSVDHILFTSDSSKVTYTAFVNAKPYAIIGDEESEACLPEPTPPVIDSHGTLVVAPTGGRAGGICGLTGGATPTLYLDGKTLRLPEGVQSATDLRFSPDGQHYAYRASFQGGAQRLVLDGIVQMNSNLGTPSTARFHYVFSPDSEHIAVDSGPPSPTGEFASGIFLDGKYIPVLPNPNMYILQFTADSKHIAWAQGVPSRNSMRIYIDGKAVAESDIAVSHTSRESWWDMAPDGSLAVLVQDDKNLKRLTITPSADTSLATLGGGGALVAKRDH
jgi:dipeptidyl aminopeptidase/acylaminoacyl peptidase